MSKSNSKEFISFIILIIIITTIIFISAFYYIPNVNLKLYLMSIAVMMLVIGSYSDIKFKKVNNLIIYPLIIVLLLLTIINFNNNNLTLINIVLSLLLLYGYFKLKMSDEKIINIGGADVKLLIPLILSLDYIHLIVFVMLLGDILFTIILLKRLKNTNLPFFVLVTIAYSLIFILNEILDSIIIT